MMPISFVLFIVLGAYVAFQPDSSAGYQYIFRVRPKGTGQPDHLDFRPGTGIFPLSVAGNGTLIHGSYFSDEEDIPASAGRVAF